MFLLFATLVGSIFNIPVAELPPERIVSHEVIRFFGMRYAAQRLCPLWRREKRGYCFFNSVYVTVSTICRISFMCAQTRIETE